MGPRLIFDAADIVGESAVYDERRDALVWVDIGGKRIHRLYLAERRHEVWPAPDFPTSIGLRADGGAVVGLSDRVALWDYGGEFRTLAIVEPDLPDNRLNEGRVGPDGAFWVGTMQNNLEPDGAPKAMTRDSGAIYRIDGNGRVSQLTRREFGIANTMAWTDDGRFLTADTTRNAIYAYDFRAGVLTNKRLFAGRSTAARRTAPASTRTGSSGTAAWPAAPALLASGRTAGSIGSSNCPAPGRQAAPSAGPTSRLFT
jgi:sugar lactone lactonase YvrE